MSGHTPGPWTFREWLSDNSEQLRAVGMEPVPNVSNDGGRYVMGGPEGRRVALVDCRTEFKRGKGHQTECAERDANARLIAAAPDYHKEAHGLAMLVLQSDLYRDLDVRDAVDAVLAIHAKAEGR